MTTFCVFYTFSLLEIKNLNSLIEESSCNHKEKEIVFENLISSLYQIAPIKCKWCEIIPFFIFIFTFAHITQNNIIKHSIHRLSHNSFQGKPSNKSPINTQN